jgi:site-specific DNA-methyltransferase (cytosine-N4-specific)
MLRKAIYTEENESALIKSGLLWNFHEEETREHLHTLHPYPAKFIPQIPRKVIEAWTKKGDVVYDPFSGCGTTLLEASLLGRPSIGTDNNSVGILVSQAKTAKYKASDLQRLHEFGELVKNELASAKPDARLIPTNPNFLYWFDDKVLQRLSALKRMILEEKEPVQSLLMAVFSSIIVRVSFQDSDTRYAKVSKTIKPSDTEKWFLSKLNEVISSLPEVMVPGRASVDIHLADARHIPFVKDKSVSLIVTSPPYLNAYDYHKYHRQRIHWIDGDVGFARNLEIGGHDEFTRPNATPDQYFSDMNACFGEWARVMRKSARCLIVVGDAIVTKKPVSVGDQFVKLMEKQGIQLENRWIRTLHATKRAFNVKNSRITHEHVLLFKKQ